MARPFTYVSSALYYDLESYLFKLTLFTDSEEYSQLNVVDRNKIDREIMYIDSVLHIMRVFRQIPSSERAIVAWKRDLDHEDEYRRIFCFSSPIVANKSLGINTSHIVAVCKGERPTAGGYVFQYYEDYEPPVKKYKTMW